MRNSLFVILGLYFIISDLFFHLIIKKEEETFGDA
jgi:hypothetical protein